MPDAWMGSVCKHCARSIKAKTIVSAMRSSRSCANDSGFVGLWKVSGGGDGLKGGEVDAMEAAEPVS